MTSNLHSVLSSKSDRKGESSLRRKMILSPGTWYRHGVDIDSRHHRQAPRRVGHKLQVDQRRLNRRVPQPARQVVDRNTVHQKVAGVAVAQRVCPDPFPRRDRAQLLRTFHRSLHPSPGGRDMRFDDSALADVSVGKCAAQSAVQFRMHRHQPCLAALAQTHTHGS